MITHYNAWNRNNKKIQNGVQELCRCNVGCVQEKKRIQIEFHYGYEKLKKKLEDSGFTVSYSKPAESLNKYATEQKMLVGYIYAKLDQ